MQKIWIRNDLNMRKGKMAAQAAHASLKLILDSMSLIENERVADLSLSTYLLNWKNAGFPLSIEMISNENELDLVVQDSLANNKAAAKVIDHGRTEFHGVHTTTCAAAWTNEVPIGANPVSFEPFNESPSLITKQVIVVRKDAKLDKFNLIEMVLKTSLMLFFEQMYIKDNKLFLPLSSDSLISKWLHHAFGKVVVSVNNESDFNELGKKVKESGLINSIFKDCLIVGPDFPSKINAYTSALKLL